MLRDERPTILHSRDHPCMINITVAGAMPVHGSYVSWLCLTDVTKDPGPVQHHLVVEQVEGSAP
jgi:hypothetical protein